MTQYSLQDVRELTYKPKDSWWTVLLVDPLASRLVRFTANHTSVTPNQLTVSALVLGLGAAACFALGGWQWLLLGVALFHLSFTVDCMDGKIARLKGNGSVFGSWLDYVFDRIRVLVCAIALMVTPYVATGDDVYIWFALAIVFTDMFRYLNSPQMAKVRAGMRRQLTRAIRDAEETVGLEPLREITATASVRSLSANLAEPLGDDRGDGQEAAADGNDEDGEEPATSPAAQARRAAREVQATALQQRFNSRFPWYVRLRNWLREHRIRPHLFSGIEFQMGVFIVSPLVGMVSLTGMLVTIAASIVLMLAFEGLLIYKLWLSTREFNQVMARIGRAVAEATPPAEAVAGAAANGSGAVSR